MSVFSKPTDTALLEVIKRWRALLSAANELPDNDPRARELFRQAFDLEFQFAAMTPVTAGGYHEWLNAIRGAEFDPEQLGPILFEAGRAAHRLGICDPPDLRTAP